jgi:cell division septum initiation protein DivIVA
MTDSRRDMVRETQHSFDVTMRGYDRHQVAETIERLEADIRVALADRDAAMARSTDLAGQLSAMHGEIDQLRRKAASAGPTTFENMSERISHMLRLAEEEAAEIRQAATQEAQALREQTAAEERAMLERHAAGQAEAERVLAEARQNAEQIASKAQIRADELVAKAQEKVARLDAESQARRAKVEEDFELSQRARRTEAARLEEERDRASTEAARQRVAAAEKQAAQMVGEAEAAAQAIRTVRDELTGRLLEARRLLGSLPDLGDRPADQAQQGARPNAEQTRPGQTAPSQAPPAPEPSTGAGEAAAARQPVRQPAPPAPPAQPAAQRGGAHRTQTGVPPAVGPQGPTTQVAMQTVSGDHVSTPPAAQQTQVIRPVSGPQPAVRPQQGAGGARPSDPPTLVQPAVSAADVAADAAARAEKPADGGNRTEGAADDTTAPAARR